MKKQKFTLIELLAATALVAILAGIGFSVYSYALNRSRESATRSLIAQIGAGLETVKNKHGFYPAAQNYSTIKLDTAASGVIEKVAFGSVEIKDNQLKTFLSVVDGELLKQNIDGAKALVDSWGGKIYYAYPGKVNKTKFDLIAPGADGKFTTSPTDDPADTLSSYKTGGEWACDDIANFQ